jgi:hypothetical protein
VALNVVKGFTRTEGGGVGRLSSVPGRIWGGMTHRETGGGLITKGRGEGGGVGVDGYSEIGREVGEGGHIDTLDVGEARMVGDGIGGTGN